jgi:hypothetical protein
VKRAARPWLWLWLLTAFLACLNPQPDEHPTAQSLDRGSNNQPNGGPQGAQAEGEPPLFNADAADVDDGASNPAQPQAPSASPEPVRDPDAGAPEAPDAGAPEAPDAGPPPDAGSGVD